MRRDVASTLAALVVGGLVASGNWAVAQQPDQPREQDEATARDTERDAEEQTTEAQQREQREREQRERQQREQERRRDQETLQDRRFQQERPQDQQFQDQRSQDQRSQDRRFQDQRLQDRGPQDRQAYDDRRTREAQSEEQGAWLGVYLADSPQQQGALVRSVYPTGPAARAGFRNGDVILAIDGQRISDPQQAIEIIDRLQPRSQAEIVVLRNNQQATLTTTLGNRQAFVGQRSESNQQNSGQRFEDDEFANIPPYLMELEHNRRMAEQHQRIEEMIERLHEEVRQLREELQTSRR